MNMERIRSKAREKRRRAEYNLAFDHLAETIASFQQEQRPLANPNNNANATVATTHYREDQIEEHHDTLDDTDNASAIAEKDEVTAAILTEDEDQVEVVDRACELIQSLQAQIQYMDEEKERRKKIRIQYEQQSSHTIGGLGGIPGQHHYGRTYSLGLLAPAAPDVFQPSWEETVLAAAMARTDPSITTDRGCK